MTEQHRADGSLRHLLTLATLPRAELERLLERAQTFVRPLGAVPPMSRTLEWATVANLFTEPSTRTRVSFELAAKRLGAQVVNLEVQLSSRAKGESMLDTVYTLQSLHVDAFVIRDAEAGVPGLVAGHVAPHVSVLSAGEAHLSHPTQGLLDALTVYQHKRRFAGLTVAIVGDIRHSRVARSAWHAFGTLGVGELRIAAPAALMPRKPGVHRLHALHTPRGRARRRRRRHDAAHPEGAHDRGSTCPRAAQYFAAWGLTRERLALARPDAIVMHPQPMNRGIEIASDVADGPQSVIRDQVRNGVAVRMAVLEQVLSAGRGERR